MADYEYVVPTGVIIADTSTIIDDINAEWREVFGADFDVNPETTQGAIIAMDTELRDGAMRNNAAVANQINPDYSGGIFLDGVWSLTGGSRKPATRSVITGAILGGQTGTIVPAGSLAFVESSGAAFVTAATVIIGADTPGVVTVDCVSQEFGPIAAPIGQLTVVGSGVLGWETITNPTAASLGRLKENDAPSRRRRRQTLALQSVALNEAITSRLYNIDEVNSLTYRENFAKVDQTIDGIFMLANSIWVCVSGGTNAQVAQALLESKSMGCAFNGAVSVSLIDPTSGQACIVQFDRPSQVTLYVRVTARFNATDGAAIIPSALMQYANGELEGDQGLVVGATVSPFEMSGAINQVEPRIFVTKVELSTDGATWSTADMVLTLKQQAVLTESRVTVIPV